MGCGSCGHSGVGALWVISRACSGSTLGWCQDLPGPSRAPQVLTQCDQPITISSHTQHKDAKLLPQMESGTSVPPAEVWDQPCNIIPSIPDPVLTTCRTWRSSGFPGCNNASRKQKLERAGSSSEQPQPALGPRCALGLPRTPIVLEGVGEPDEMKQLLMRFPLITASPILPSLIGGVGRFTMTT